MNIDEINNEIRKEIFLTANKVHVAHIASAFSIVEIMNVLYLQNVLKVDQINPDWDERDRFILSKGHGSLALYSVLRRKGFFDENLMNSFCKPGSVLGGEPTHEIPGVEVATGSLGHGLSVGVGMAIGFKMDKKNNQVYVLLGDGECQEGTIWEAIMYASAKKLDNLTIIIDCNKIQKMGSIEDIIGIKSWRKTLESFNLNILEIDGHNNDEIINAFKTKFNNGLPKVILANTVKGKGVSIIENDPRWHFRLPNKKEKKVFMSELKIEESEMM